jgi:hypothetical protein
MAGAQVNYITKSGTTAANPYQQTDFGNTRPNSFWGAGFFSVASQLTKRIPVTETAGFDIGVTAYNLFNYPNFAVPNGNSLQVLSG